MAELKTKSNSQSVTTFIKSVENYKRRKDCIAVMAMMKEITGKRPKMWGTSIVGYGKYHYKYKSGREGDWFVTGFSPRKQNLTVYIMPGFSKYQKIMKKIRKTQTGRILLIYQNP